MFWRPEKAVFRNRKKSLFHGAKTIWRDLLYASTCFKHIVLETCRGEFSESERNRFYVEPKQLWRDYALFCPLRSEFSESETTRFPWRRSKLQQFSAFHILKKWIIRMRKKSLFMDPKQPWRGFWPFGSLKTRIFRIRNNSILNGAKRNL